MNGDEEEEEGDGFGYPTVQSDAPVLRPKKSVPRKKKAAASATSATSAASSANPTDADTDSGVPGPSSSTLSVPAVKKPCAAGGKKKGPIDFTNPPPGLEVEFDVIWDKLLDLAAKPRYGDPTVSTAQYKALEAKELLSSEEKATLDTWKKKQSNTKRALTNWGVLAAKTGFHLLISDDPEFGVREDLRSLKRGQTLDEVCKSNPSMLFRAGGVPDWATSKRKRSVLQCKFMQFFFPYSCLC